MGGDGLEPAAVPHDEPRDVGLGCLPCVEAVPPGRADEVRARPTCRDVGDGEAQLREVPRFEREEPVIHRRQGVADVLPVLVTTARGGHLGRRERALR